MNILVTGANGFVGSHLTRELCRRGHGVRGVEHPDSDLWRLRPVLNQVDVVRLDLLTAGVAGWAGLLQGIDACIHCAWVATPGKYLFSQDNTAWLDTTVDFYRALKGTSCRRVVGIGTCAEYDLSYGRLSENTPLAPATLYAACKSAAYLVGCQMAKEYDICFAWARLFYLYGTEEPANRLVPDIIQNLLRDNPVKLTEGSQVRDFMDISETARAIADITEKKLEGPINVASGVPTTVRQMATMIGRLMEKEPLLQFGMRAVNDMDPAIVSADITRLTREVGFNRQPDLEQSIRHVIEWWRQQQENREGCGDHRGSKNL